MHGHFKITHLDGLDTLKWKPNPKHNTHMQGHFEITQPYMQYLHSRSFWNNACVV
jgi:hypothetical protein